MTLTWHASLQLDYSLSAERTAAHFRHSGPLRILQSLYPEGDSVCHNVLVHLPGGLVGGDTLDIQATVASGAHGLVTTPGTTRFYRSLGEQAEQRAHVTLAAQDELLLNNPLGLAGHRCMATLFFAAGSKLDRKRRQAALDVARVASAFLAASGTESTHLVGLIPVMQDAATGATISTAKNIRQPTQTHHED